MRLRLWFVFLLMVTTGARAQVVRIGAGPGPNITIGAVSLSASPSNVNFTLVQGGVAPASQPVTISTGVIGIGLLSGLQLYAYFAGSNALSDTYSNSIPSSAISGMCSTCSAATGYTAFTQSGPGAANSSLLLFSDSGLARLGGGRNDALNLRIDLSSQPQTPAGSYQGTLVLLVQAF